MMHTFKNRNDHQGCHFSFLKKTFTLILLICGFLTSLNAQTITVNPIENPKAVTNPGMGGRHLNEYPEKRDLITVVKQYVNWASVENTATEDLTLLTDLTEGTWGSKATNPANSNKLNLKVIPRVFLHYWYPAKDAPSHLQPLDYKSEKTKNDILRVIRKIGKVWDKDPRVFAVETGIMGTWGEQEQYLPVTVPYSGDSKDGKAIMALPGYVKNMFDVDLVSGVRWEKILSDAFEEAFPNKRLLVRELGNWKNYGNGSPFGNYWDVFASPKAYNGSYQDLLNCGDQKSLSLNGNVPPKLYLTSPMVGEIPDDAVFYPSPTDIGYDPVLTIGRKWTDTIANATYAKRVSNYIKSAHISYFNFRETTAGQTFNSSSAAVQEMLKAIGYRYHITEFKCPQRVEPGATLNMSAKIKNLGSAPSYQNYPLYFFLLKNETDSNPIYIRINDIDIRNWLPGSDFDWDPLDKNGDGSIGTQAYLNPPVDNVVNATITIPATVAKGDYMVGIALLEPSTQVPAIYFAIKNFYTNSQTQPLCRMGVGQNPATTPLPDFADILIANDKRSYNPDHTYYKTMPEVKLTASIAGASEPSRKGQFTFTRQPSSTSPIDSSKPLKVTFDIGGTATNGVDYQTLSNSVVIPAGQTSVTLDVNVLDDKITEKLGETVVLTLTTNQLDYFLANPKKATVTISDDQDVDGTLGNAVFSGPWVEGMNNPKKAGKNRALVVLAIGDHIKTGTETLPMTPLSVTSMKYGGVPLRKVVDNPYKLGAANYAYSGVFVLDEAGIAAATSELIEVTWTTPIGDVVPNGGSNVASAFFADIDQTILSGDATLMNPLTQGYSFSGAATSVDLTFDNSSTTPVIEEFKTDSGDVVICVGNVFNSSTGNFSIDSGFTSRTNKEGSGASGLGTSGLFYGYKIATGTAERPIFSFDFNRNISMAGFVLKKSGYTFNNWTDALGLSGSAALPNADPDGDGMSNFMEYALGLNPKVVNSNPVTKDLVSIDGKSYLRLTVLRDPNTFSKVTIQGLTSSTLKDPSQWSALKTKVEENSSTRYVVRDSVATQDASKRFIKLKFDLNP